MSSASFELRRAVAALAVEVPGEVWDDVNAKVEAVLAEVEEARQRRAADLSFTFIFDQVVHAMRAAWIEWKHGNGSEAAMCWIENTLDGPDQIPDVIETGKDAQAYFDRALAESRERELKAREAVVGA